MRHWRAFRGARVAEGEGLASNEEIVGIGTSGVADWAMGKRKLPSRIGTSHCWAMTKECSVSKEMLHLFVVFSYGFCIESCRRPLASPNYFSNIHGAKGKKHSGLEWFVIIQVGSGWEGVAASSGWKNGWRLL